MPRRSTTLTNSTSVDITREIASKYDNVKIVADNIEAIEALSLTDPVDLISLLNEATNFDGITVVSGVSAGWNPATKVLTVPTVKGDKGDTGTAGTNGIDGLSPVYTFSIDNDGNLVYSATYTDLNGLPVWEW